MKGTYILTLDLPEIKRIQVGRLGIIGFKKGYYAYVGSGLNGLEERLKRHLRSEKKLFWHIDYFLNYAGIMNIFCRFGTKKYECETANILSKNFQIIDDFGSSDCSCEGHLFIISNLDRYYNKIEKLGFYKW